MKRPSHATIVAYLALFVALGSGAYAATQLPKNSVGAKQLKKKAVTAAKIKDGAVTTPKIKDGAVTTVTFEEKGGKTLLIFHELYPSKEALDEAFVGMEGGMPEQLEQLDELLRSLSGSVGEP